MTTIAVTGASGLVGTALCRVLETQGTDVLRLGRRGPVRFALGEPIDSALFQDVDALVHAAWDFDAATESEMRDRNLKGSLTLFDAARQAGVRRLVFVSTVSAFPAAKSLYGRTKLAIEEAVLETGGVVVRPGLIYGTPGKGMFGTLARLARLPLLPVFSGGNQPFVLTHQDDLAAALAAFAGPESRFEGQLILGAHPEIYTFRRLLQTISAMHGRKLRTVSVPGSLGLLALRAKEAIGLGGGLRSDSLVSLLNTDPAMDFSATEELGLVFRPFSEADPSEI